MSFDTKRRALGSMPFPGSTVPVNATVAPWAVVRSCRIS